MFVVAIGFIGLNGYNAIKCVSMSNQESKEIPITVNINSNKPLFYPDSVTVNELVVVAMILINFTVNYAFLMLPRILESLTGCCTMFLFAVFCKIGSLKRNAY